MMGDHETPSNSKYVMGGGCKRALIISVAFFSALFVVATFGFFTLVSVMDKRYHESELRFSQDDMNAQIAAVKAGPRKSIFLYCSVGTDGLLEQLRGVPELEELNLHLTDVSDAGLKPLTELPRLKRLVVYGGAPGVSDKGFVHIASLPNLECLKLINTFITDESIPSLKNLQKLRRLVLYHEGFRRVTFTDAGLSQLKDLRKLERLELTGGWASLSAVTELRKSLPGCVIDTESDPEADE